MQVICPGCAKLIEVGQLPPGTLPSCPFCRTVFRLVEDSPGDASLAMCDDLPATDRLAGALSTRGTWRAVGWGVLVVLFFGGLLAALLVLSITVLRHRQQERDLEQTKATSTGWQPVGIFSGRGRMETPRFRVESRTWRMRWSCKGYQAAAKHRFEVHVLDDSGKFVASPISADGDDAQTTVMETEPGAYFLVIRGTNVEWELTVEHQP